MASILYAIDAYTFRFEQPDVAVTHLKTADIRQVYESGVELLRQRVEETKRLYNEIRRNKLHVPVDAYNMTIDESLPVFINKYGIIFDAHNTMASIDYPLAIDDMCLQGVFYIKQYLEHLQIETRFCRFFKERDLLALLSDFGKVCRFDYRIELFNIFELVLTQSVFSVLAEGKANQVKISAQQYNRLDRLFAHSNPSQIRSSLYGAMDRVQRELKTDLQLTSYMNQMRENLVKRVINAANYNSLDKVIITGKEEKPKSIVLLLSEADRMSDVRFRVLVKEMMQYEKKEDKVRLIRANFFSLHDYLDLLDSGCLFGEEVEALFETFGDLELAYFRENRAL